MDKLPKYLAILGRAAMSRFCCACDLDVFLVSGLMNTRPVSSYIVCHGVCMSSAMYAPCVAVSRAH
jgi:hypothetical protein